MTDPAGNTPGRGKYVITSGASADLFALLFPGRAVLREKLLFFGENYYTLKKFDHNRLYTMCK